jgi:hypothetical protein
LNCRLTIQGLPANVPAGYHDHIFHVIHPYNIIMSAVKRIPVAEPVWKDLAEMHLAGQTYTELLSEMIEERKKTRLAQDMQRIEEEGTFVPLSEIRH